jgi:hypothetical protein
MRFTHRPQYTRDYSYFNVPAIASLTTISSVPVVGLLTHLTIDISVPIVAVVTRMPQTCFILRLLFTLLYHTGGYSLYDPVPYLLSKTRHALSWWKVLAELLLILVLMVVYRLDGLGIESRWGVEIFCAPVTGPKPTQPPAQAVPGLSRGKGGQGVVVTTQLLMPGCQWVASVPPPPSGPVQARHGVIFSIATSRKCTNYKV